MISRNESALCVKGSGAWRITVWPIIERYRGGGPYSTWQSRRSPIAKRRGHRTRVALCSGAISNRLYGRYAEIAYKKSRPISRLSHPPRPILILKVGGVIPQRFAAPKSTPPTRRRPTQPPLRDIAPMGKITTSAAKARPFPKIKNAWWEATRNRARDARAVVITAYGRL